MRQRLHRHLARLTWLHTLRRIDARHRFAGCDWPSNDDNWIPSPPFLTHDRAGMGNGQPPEGTIGMRGMGKHIGAENGWPLRTYSLPTRCPRSAAGRTGPVTVKSGAGPNIPTFPHS